MSSIADFEKTVKKERELLKLMKKREQEKRKVLEKQPELKRKQVLQEKLHC